MRDLNKRKRFVVADLVEIESKISQAELLKKFLDTEIIALSAKQANEKRQAIMNAKDTVLDNSNNSN